MSDSKRSSSLVLIPTLLLAAAPLFAAEGLPTFDANESPVGIAIDKVGNTWVSLQTTCEVRRYTPAWGESLRLTLIPGCPPGSGISGLAVDSTGELYVTALGPDPAVRGVWVIPSYGAPHRIPGTEVMSFPNSIAFDHNNGTMYVTDMAGGAVYRISRNGKVDLWANGPVLAGVPIPPAGPAGGPNGIAVDRGYVIVSVTFLPRLVRIPIETDGSAGPPEVIYDFGAFFSRQMFAIDDIALDVFGNVYAAVVAGTPGGVARLAIDGSGITMLETLPAAVTTVTFGTGKGERQSIFAAENSQFGGEGLGIVRVDAGVPGRPLP